MTDLPVVTPVFGFMRATTAGEETAFVNKAARLGCKFFRPNTAVYADNAAESRPDITTPQTANMKLVLTVRANSSGTNGATIYPPNLAAYQTGLTTILNAYHPVILCVENEPTSALFWESTIAQYHSLLTTARTIALTINPPIPVADGGVVSNTLALLAINYYLGLNTAAGDAAALLIGKQLGYDVNIPVVTLGDVAAILLRVDSQLAILKGTTYFASMPTIDAINHHIYEYDYDAYVLMHNYIRTIFPTLPSISNEFGVRRKKRKSVLDLTSGLYDKGNKAAIFYSNDAVGGALDLYDSTGDLRSIGYAYKAAIRLCQ